MLPYNPYHSRHIIFRPWIYLLYDIYVSISSIYIYTYINIKSPCHPTVCCLEGHGSFPRLDRSFPRAFHPSHDAHPQSATGETLTGSRETNPHPTKTDATGLSRKAHPGRKDLMPFCYWWFVLLVDFWRLLLFFFTPIYLGRDDPIWQHIFEMGWKHQLVIIDVLKALMAIPTRWKTRLVGFETGALPPSFECLWVKCNDSVKENGINRTSSSRSVYHILILLRFSDGMTWKWNKMSWTLGALTASTNQVWSPRSHKE